MSGIQTDDWEQVLPGRLDGDLRNRLLADECRRTVLETVARLHRTTHETTLGELASDIGRLEGHDDTDRKEALVIDLHHVHLPMMDEAGVIEYDPETNRIGLDNRTLGVSRSVGKTHTSD
jgi:hypothetical protein